LPYAKKSHRWADLKDKVKSLPEFDGEMFFQITGIKIDTERDNKKKQLIEKANELIAKADELKAQAEQI